MIIPILHLGALLLSVWVFLVMWDRSVTERYCPTVHYNWELVATQASLEDCGEIHIFYKSAGDKYLEQEVDKDYIRFAMQGKIPCYVKEYLMWGEQKCGNQ